MTDLRVRRYPGDGPTVVVLHGGPGAPGSAAGLARGLGDDLDVLEPLQRRADDRPLTVARHVEDLLGVIRGLGDGASPALVGSSWGAMLALAFAATHPDRTSRVALIGCGTFDLRARGRMNAILDERIDDALRGELEAVYEEIADPDERLAAVGRLIEPVYAVDHLPSDADEPLPCDDRGHTETWEDMIRCQADGLYPAAFAAFDGPVMMLHVDHDHHPGPLIRDSLLPVLPQLEYVEFARCGHYPWRERGTRDPFFEQLHRWLVEVRSSPSEVRDTLPSRTPEQKGKPR